MCGIAGLCALDSRPLPEGAIEKMAACLRHRGPDEEGFLKTPSVHLAIERLRVIDLSTGSQPIYNEDRTVSIVFNGEIYNYKPLRREMESRGHRFSTHSDTETIVHLYEEYGEDCVHHLNGMFSFALWDSRKQKLLIARDPAGIKPLFYAVHQGRLLFASEMKALLSDPQFPRRVRAEALTHYLSYYYVTSPMTIYQDIQRLPAGHLLICEQGKVRVQKYWDMQFVPDRGPSLQDWKRQFVKTFDESIQRHLQSDVPVGIFLSGGLDSASIVAFASRYLTSINTFTIGYAERSYCEFNEARAVAERYHTRHHEILLTPQRFADTLPRVLAQMDEPQGDWSSVASYVLSSEVKGKATVVLTGAGGDELLGGYPTILAGRVARHYRKLPSWVRSKIIAPLVHHIPARRERMSLRFMAESFIRGAEAPAEVAHQRFKEVFSLDERHRLLSQPGVREALERTDPFSAFAQHETAYAAMSPDDRLLYLDFKVFLADCTLPVMDITTSAHALECRVPFLDGEMLKLASRIPGWYKVRRWTTKYLFREAMRDYLPAEVIAMKKKGLLIPGAPWMAGPLKPMILDILSQSEPRLKHLFDFSVMRNLVQEHFEQKADHTRRISCFVSLALWDSLIKPDWPDFIHDR